AGRRGRDRERPAFGRPCRTDSCPSARSLARNNAAKRRSGTRSAENITGRKVMPALTVDGALLRSVDTTPSNAGRNVQLNAQLVARLERLPVTPRLMLLRVIVGIATFFDAYTVLAIAFAMPQLVSQWKLTPTEVGMIISAGYVGQLFGAVIF